MKFTYLLILFMCSLAPVYSQQTIKDSVIDNKYREDQFYLAITFNLLVDKPDGISQNGFSGGLHFGYIRDMPINKRRNLSIGLGAGLSMNTYNENLFIGELENEETVFQVLGPGLDYNKNWLSTYQIEVPLQFRWRTSTADTYNFWRIYSGLQLGYIYAYKANFEQPGNQVIQTDIPELERYRVGATFAFGYASFNFYFYYSLEPFFKNAYTVENQTIELNAFKLGLIFYIL
ncbi:porin family protein [Flavimarina sp. Hel_I_48]|uniref:porin family protein n=1 Tax=Flavimarina sp. Hel_I_48 TaxID=1392488 RepID=UPI000690174E|nr:porin family protein [Flavimarina sp. Hel_I_48]